MEEPQLGTKDEREPQTCNATASKTFFDPFCVFYHHVKGDGQFIAPQSSVYVHRTIHYFLFYFYFVLFHFISLCNRRQVSCWCKFGRFFRSEALPFRMFSTCGQTVGLAETGSKLTHKKRSKEQKQMYRKKERNDLAAATFTFFPLLETHTKHFSSVRFSLRDSYQSKFSIRVSLLLRRTSEMFNQQFSHSSYFARLNRARTASDESFAFEM